MHSPWRLAIFLFCGSAIYAPAQQTPGRTVTLNVVVTGKDGKAVAGLEQKHFTILDNKKPQAIGYFQPIKGTATESGDKLAMEAILLVDRINVSFEVANDERTRLLKFLRQDGGKLAQPMSMIFFTDAGIKTQPASSDGNVLATALEQSDNALRVDRRNQGILGFAAQAERSLKALSSIAAFEEKKPGRKILIWLSSGWPPISGPRSIPGAAEHQRFFDSIIETSDALVRSRITLYTVDPVGLADALQFKAGQLEPYMKPVTVPSKAQADNMALPVLAVQTGGRNLSASSDIAAQVADCLSDLSAWYILAYTSAPPDGPNEYHGLEIKLVQPGLKARTLTGFYSQPVAAHTP
jgi:VWFA-related protein